MYASTAGGTRSSTGSPRLTRSLISVALTGSSGIFSQTTRSRRPERLSPAACGMSALRATASVASSRMRSGLSQFGRSASASSPAMRNSSSSGLSDRSASSVSAVYDGPGRSSSSVSTRNAGSPSSASRSIASLWAAAPIIPPSLPPPAPRRGPGAAQRTAHAPAAQTPPHLLPPLLHLYRHHLHKHHNALALHPEGAVLPPDAEASAQRTRPELRRLHRRPLLASRRERFRHTLHQVIRTLALRRGDERRVYPTAREQLPKPRQSPSPPRQVDLVDPHDLLPRPQPSAVLRQLPVHRIHVRRRVRPRAVHQMDQHPCPLHMAQEIQPQPSAGVRPLYQARDVSHNEALVLQLHHPQRRLHRRERIVRYPRPCRRDRPQER